MQALILLELLSKNGVSDALGVQCEPFENIIPAGVILNGTEPFFGAEKDLACPAPGLGTLPREIPLPTEQRRRSG